MRSKQMITATLLAATVCNTIHATAIENKDNGPASAAHEQKGKAIIQIFTNFHSGFGSANDKRGFDLDRSYLGYEYDLGKGLSIKGVMDIGKSSDVNDYQRIAYIKNALVTWRYKKLTLSGGLIPMNQFSVQEKFWGNRYVMKSFQDQYKFGHSADLGISASYRFTDWVTTDVTIANGEGYKKVQVKDGMLYSAGIKLNPLKALTLKLYGSINQKTDKEEKDTYNLSTFLGYKTSDFSFGGEYNWMKNAKNIKHNNLHGVSAYGQARLASFAHLFVRYDQLFSLGEIGRNQEELSLMGGVEFKIGKYIKLSPNFRYIDGKQNDQEKIYMGYVSCYFGI